MESSGILISRLKVRTWGALRESAGTHTGHESRFRSTLTLIGLTFWEAFFFTQPPDRNTPTASRETRLWKTRLVCSLRTLNTLRYTKAKKIPVNVDRIRLLG